MKKNKDVKLNKAGVVIVLILAILVIFLLIVYFGLKNNVSKEIKKTENKSTSGESSYINGYVEELSSYFDCYSFRFSGYVSSSSNEHYYLGDLLSKVYQYEELYIEGTITDNFSEIFIYPSDKAGDEEYKTYVCISAQGVYIHRYNIMDILEGKEDTPMYFRKGYIRYCDGATGRYVLDTIISVLADGNDNYQYGVTDEGYNALSIKEGDVISSDTGFLGYIINGYKGDLTTYVYGSGEYGERTFEIKGDGSDLSFVFNCEENKTFYQTPDFTYEDVYTYEEFIDEYLYILPDTVNFQEGGA